MDEFIQELKIPKERVGVLIGEKGRDKRRIQKRLDVKLDITSDGEVIISGKDGLNLFIAENVVKAIGRGFNPDIALMLQKDEYAFELIDITDFSGKSQKKLVRLRGRLIGSDGKARRIVEDLSETAISVFGKTVGIIGLINNVAISRKAVESLLSGSQHSTVYKWLEKQRRDGKII